jgi:hypothetical protein
MKNLLLSAGASLLFPILLRGAQPGFPLPPDDPRLYQFFFTFQDGLASLVDGKKVRDVVGGTKTEGAVARYLGINQTELAKLNAISHSFVLDLAKLQSDLKTYVDQMRSQNQQPDAGKLRDFDLKKQQLISTAVQQLSTSLSPAGWSGIHSYINNVHRLHTAVVPARVN